MVSTALPMEVASPTPTGDGDGAVRDADLVSHPGATPRFRTVDRLDPFWDGVWSNGSTGVWASADVARRQATAGLVRVPAHLRYADADPERFFDPVTSPQWQLALGALGAVNQWRTMTTEQMAAMVGSRSLASRNNPWMRAAFGAGLIDVGEFGTPLTRYAKNPRTRLVRPSATPVFDRVVAPRLSYMESLAVTGGTGWDARRQYDRHNVLTTELGLRLAEFCEVGAVLGEKLSTLRLLAHSPRGAPLGRIDSTRGAAADMTVVRGDGLRIAVELTASASTMFAKKAERWAQLLSQSPLAASGLVVMFVVAPPPEPDEGARRQGAGGRGSWAAGARDRYVTDQVRKQVALAARRYPGVAGDRVAERMIVARWCDWFPASHTVDGGFLSLDGWRPTGPPARNPYEPGTLWEPVSVLDPFDLVLEPHDPGHLTAAVDNASLLAGNPHWLRDPQRAPLLWPDRMAQVGCAELPVSPPSRAGRVTGEKAAIARGIPGLTRAPDRLRPLGG